MSKYGLWCPVYSLNLVLLFMVLYGNENIPKIDKHSLKEYIFIQLCRLFVICMDYVFQRCQFVSLWNFFKVDFFTPAISLKITWVEYQVSLLTQCRKNMRGRNSSTIVLSGWANFARPLPGTNTAQKASAAISFLLFTLDYKQMLVMKISINF